MTLYYRADGRLRHCHPTDPWNAVQVLLALHRAGLVVDFWYAEY